MGRVVHGHSPKVGCTAEYRAYYAMKNRVLNQNQSRFGDYGGRGITICDRWLFGEAGLTGFACFLADMGERPSPEHSIDRRDNDGNYEPSNVRWSTRSEQARNSRNTRLIEVGGFEGCLLDIVFRFGKVSYDATCMRLHRGWHIEDALFTPVRRTLVPTAVPF